MRIELKKFGTTLISRQSGKEAFAALQSTVIDIAVDEIIEIDFEGVITFSPSWGDEFLTPLLNQFGDRLVLLPTSNPSVKITIKLLEEINKESFKAKS
ncbi:MAG: hypothetical protein A3A97_02780 [Candidatus Terrybacteria bacterium RIFCSPLOWO2_01_FULL_40_23]|uniref:Uncharacterized protein n=1 Tax=Candidatus Terrybacteria bacterium RIFCSPLOWO2_01_FULL_40_23 TaxID=1802366 RepID=A0A1G2PS97_9BACT|nr:MAG: hypothetical protein UT82_C0010G0007 [Parcubacteria group bacterium GW2011_GWB1_40_14]OHA51173.1 MAG: hypothetical protein A3A97_02780 [Candidatus Terrybacteria bacterium RIFCSPLOWO2_01_FULL_40_23]